jgi:hypothetical protein
METAACTLLDNLDLDTYPPDHIARSYANALLVPKNHRDQEAMGVLLEAAGWVKDPLGGMGEDRYFPPLAGYVVRALRNCVFEATAVDKVKDPTRSVLSREAMQVLNSPKGDIPREMTINPPAMVAAMAHRITRLAEDGEGRFQAEAEAIGEWIKRVQDVRPDEENVAFSIGGGSGRSYGFPGEIFACIDRQTGSLSLLPTGDVMGKRGPYSQRTKIYNPDKRKAGLAVVCQKGVRPDDVVSAGGGRYSATEWGILPLIRKAVAEEILLMEEEDFEAAFGEDSIRRTARTAGPETAATIQTIACAARAVRAEKRTGVDLGRAAEKLVSEIETADKKLDFPLQEKSKNTGERRPHSLDALVPAAGVCPWLFPTYISADVRKSGAMHLHGYSGRILRAIFDSMAESDNFVLHSSGSGDYNAVYRKPFEESIADLGRELDGDEATKSRKAMQRVRIEIFDSRERGSVGFLDLVRGVGVTMADGRRMDHAEAMGAMLGPDKEELGASDEILESISTKIDDITAVLTGGGCGEGVGSFRDFCAKVVKKSAAAGALFGVEAVRTLTEARASLINEEKAGGGGPERTALQAAVTDCLCHYFFGAAMPQPDSKRRLVERLVATAANTEFLYFAAQAGAEGLVKIGRAVDVDSRCVELSKDGHDTFALAHIAVPGLPVGDWALKSIEGAAKFLGKEAGRKKAVSFVNKLTGKFRKVESGGTADFFVKAVYSLVSEGGDYSAEKGTADAALRELSEDEVEKLLSKDGTMSSKGARAVHGIIQAVCGEVLEGEDSTGRQARIREASSAVLSILVVDAMRGKRDAKLEKKAKECFFSVDEVTQMPVHKDAWPYRIQTGTMVAEIYFHRKFHKARVYGEWFHLLPAIDSVVGIAESMYSVKAVKSCNPKSPSGIASLVSNLQISGAQLVSRTNILPADREGYDTMAGRGFSREGGVSGEGEAAEKGTSRSDGLRLGKMVSSEYDNRGSRDNSGVCRSR